MIIISKEIYNQIIKAVGGCVAKDDSRPVLRNIKLDIDNEFITATALDGYTLGQIKIKHGCNVLPFSCIIKPIRVTADTTKIEISVSGDDVNMTLFGDNEITYKFKSYRQFEFTNTDPIIDKNFRQRKFITFDPVKMIATCKALIETSEKLSCAKIYIDFEKPYAPFYLTNIDRGYNPEIMQLVLPIRNPEERKAVVHEQ